MKLSVILLNYNSEDDTALCLTSLAQIRTKHHVTIVVVDNSPHKSASLAKKAENGEIVYLKQETNTGFTGGNNAGIKYACQHGADYMLLLNNDTIVSEGLIDSLVKTSRHCQDRALVSPKIFFAPGYEFHTDRYSKSERGRVIWYAGGLIDWANVYASHRGVDEVDAGQYDKTTETAFISGCCMLIPRTVIDTVGVFDDSYFLYYEDADYCMRVQKHGYKIIYEPSAVLWHKNAQSSGSSGSSLHVYYQTRNRLLFGMRYAPLRSKIALIRESIRQVIYDQTRRSAITDFYTGRLGKKR